MAEVQPMAYWHNLSWAVRQRTLNLDGSITPGRIERMDDLAFNYELDKAVVKTKAVQEIQYDLFGNLVTKGKKPAVTTVKKKYVEATFKNQSITFQTEYQVALGTLDILAKIEEIRDMIGYSAPLILGREYYAKDPATGLEYLAAWPRIWGLYEMQLTKVQVSSTELDELGRLLKATVKFTLTQTTQKAAITASFTSPSDGVLLLLQNWVKNGYVYEEVTPTAKQNPKQLKWYEIDSNGEYVLTTDTKVNPNKTYYQRSANLAEIPEKFWSALACSPDPQVKALIKQKKEDEKRALKEAKTAITNEIKQLNTELKNGTYSGPTYSM